MKKEISDTKIEGEFKYLIFTEKTEFDDGSVTYATFCYHPCKATKTQWIDIDETLFEDRPEVADLVKKHKVNWTAELKEKYKDYREEEMLKEFSENSVISQQEIDSILNGI